MLFNEMSETMRDSAGSDAESESDSGSSADEEDHGAYGQLQKLVDEGWKKCIKVGEYINNNNVIKSIVRIIQTERTNKGDKIFNLFNIS